MSYSKTGLIRYVYWCNNGIDVTGVTNHSVNYWGQQSPALILPAKVQVSCLSRVKDLENFESKK